MHDTGKYLCTLWEPKESERWVSNSEPGNSGCTNPHPSLFTSSIARGIPSRMRSIMSQCRGYAYVWGYPLHTPRSYFFAPIVYMSLQTRMCGLLHVLKYFSRTVRAPGKIRGTMYVGNSLRDLSLHDAAAGRDGTASGQSRAGLAKAYSAMVRRKQDHRNNTIDITSQRNVGEERLN
jgi:hypothetical protein